MSILLSDPTPADVRFNFTFHYWRNTKVARSTGASLSQGFCIRGSVPQITHIGLWNSAGGFNRSGT